MVILTEEEGLKDARYKENNIIIGNSMIRNMLPPQLKKMSEHYKFICGCECFIHAKSIHSSSLAWRDYNLNNFKA